MKRHPLRGNDRGAVMVEFILVLPLLLVLAFGTAEMGLAWVTNNRVESSTSTAARIAASSGSLAEADGNVLQSLQASLPQEQYAALDRVVIFKPTNTDGGVPTGCMLAVGSPLNTGLTGSCNSYAGATIRSVDLTNLGTLDDAWAPGSRKDRLSQQPDYVGVWVRTTHPSKTGTFFADMTITKTSIYRIQPDIDG